MKGGYELSAGLLLPEESNISKFESSLPSCYKEIFVRVGV